MMLSFPNIAAPSSVEEEIFNPVLRSQAEDATVITRAKTTKQPMTFTVKWSLLTNADYETLKSFYMSTKGGSVQFSWTHPLSKNQYTVRFTTMDKSQFVQPAYWSTSVTLEQV